VRNIVDADAGLRAERLEYDLDVQARAANGDVATFDAEPSSDGSFDWYAFDPAAPRGPGGDDPATVIATTFSVMPTHVFHSMPNFRWWDFESGLTDFGAVEPEGDWPDCSSSTS
jgi:hypothetical protein